MHDTKVHHAISIVACTHRVSLSRPSDLLLTLIFSQELADIFIDMLQRHEASLALREYLLPSDRA